MIGLPDRAKTQTKQKILRIEELGEPVLAVDLARGAVYEETLRVLDKHVQVVSASAERWNLETLTEALNDLLIADPKREAHVVDLRVRQQINDLQKKVAHLSARQRVLNGKKADLQSESEIIASINRSIAHGSNLGRRARRRLEDQLIDHQESEVHLRGEVRSIEREIDRLYRDFPMLEKHESSAPPP
jgi:superfamily II RNA helicase